MHLSLFSRRLWNNSLLAAIDMDVVSRSSTFYLPPTALQMHAYPQAESYIARTSDYYHHLSSNEASILKPECRRLYNDCNLCERRRSDFAHSLIKAPSTPYHHPHPERIAETKRPAALHNFASHIIGGYSESSQLRNNGHRLEPRGSHRQWPA